MKKEELINHIKARSSFLCVGLDSDIRKIPKFLLSQQDPVFEFNKAIIDATLEHCVAYKPNIAFYEAEGTKGWESLQKTMEYIPESHFTIADAKRGDIGNTSNLYARAFFENLNFDSITVAPYMGVDSVSPFLKYRDKWVILLALTSNEGSNDFQNLHLKEGDEMLYESVIRKSSLWADSTQMMYVVGATRAESLAKIRELIPDYFLLIPGVGAQGGSLEEVCKYGLNKDIGLLVNSTRNIIYASAGSDFASRAGKEAIKLKEEMAGYLEKYG
jgi:orotidine-5'-phosphate decarboxylase